MVKFYGITQKLHRVTWVEGVCSLVVRCRSIKVSEVRFPMSPGEAVLALLRVRDWRNSPATIRVPARENDDARLIDGVLNVIVLKFFIS